MPWDMAASDDSTPFTITLPNEVIEAMMDLQPSKLYGSNRAEIAKNLILDKLKELAALGFVKPRQAGDGKGES